MSLHLLEKKRKGKKTHHPPACLIAKQRTRYIVSLCNRRKGMQNLCVSGAVKRLSRSGSTSFSELSPRWRLKTWKKRALLSTMKVARPSSVFLPSFCFLFFSSWPRTIRGRKKKRDVVAKRAVSSVNSTGEFFRNPRNRPIHARENRNARGLFSALVLRPD